MIHNSVVRTLEEIDETIRKGEEFSTKHPHSMFGDDNVATFELRRRILERAKNGASIRELENSIGLLGDEEYMNADITVQWLSGDEDEDIY